MSREGSSWRLLLQSLGMAGTNLKQAELQAPQKRWQKAALGKLSKAGVQ